MAFYLLEDFGKGELVLYLCNGGMDTGGELEGEIVDPLEER